MVDGENEVLRTGLVPVVDLVDAAHLARRFPLSKYLRDRHAARKVERKKRGKLDRVGEKVNEKALDIALKNPALVIEAAKRTTKEIDDSLPIGVGLAALGVAVVGTIVVLKAIDDGKKRR